MLNILPVEVKKKLAQEYFMRLGILAFLVLSLGGVCMAIALMPAFILAKSEHASLSAFISKVEGNAGEDVFTTVRVTKEKLSFFSEKSAPPKALTFFSESVAARAGGISIQGYSYTKGSNKAIIKGIARTRSNLVAYRDAVGKIPSVDSVELPISELAKSTDISFNLSVGLKK